MVKNNGKPWDVKTVNISLGGEADENGWLEAEVFDDETFRITFRGADMRWDTEDRSDCTVEDLRAVWKLHLPLLCLCVKFDLRGPGHIECSQSLQINFLRV